MPIEVRELLFRGIVEQEKSGNQNTASMPKNGNADADSKSPKAQADIIELCLDEVFKALKRKKER